RESRLAASLDHPNVVTVYDAGDADGTLHIAMRCGGGIELAEYRRREGPLSPAQALSMLEQVGSALDAAHQRGLIHRDVKPANVLIASGECYLTDFGLTKRATPSDVSAAPTRTGQFLGTVDYVAPEQIEGAEIDGRVDVYALTCMLHECLTGSRPVPKDSELAIISAHLRDPPPRPTELRPDLPAAIDDVVATGMAKSPQQRYSTCAELTAAAREALGVASSDLAAVGAPGSDNSSTPPPKSTAGSRLRPTEGSTSVADDPRTIAESRGPRRARRVLVPAVAVLCAAAVAAAVILLTTGGTSSRRHGQTTKPPAAKPPGATAPPAHVVG